MLLFTTALKSFLSDTVSKYLNLSYMQKLGLTTPVSYWNNCIVTVKIVPLCELVELNTYFPYMLFF